MPTIYILRKSGLKTAIVALLLVLGVRFGIGPVASDESRRIEAAARFYNGLSEGAKELIIRGTVWNYIYRGAKITSNDLRVIAEDLSREHDLEGVGQNEYRYYTGWSEIVNNTLELYAYWINSNYAMIALIYTQPSLSCSI